MSRANRADPVTLVRSPTFRNNELASTLNGSSPLKFSWGASAGRPRGYAKLAADAVTTAKIANRVDGTVQTTDATPTTLITIPLDDDTEYIVVARVSLQEDSQADGNAAVRRCWAYRRSGGGATIGSQDTPFTGQAYGTITFAVSSNDLLLQVTGIAATTINWGAVVEYHPTVG